MRKSTGCGVLLSGALPPGAGGWGHCFLAVLPVVGRMQGPQSGPGAGRRVLLHPDFAPAPSGAVFRSQDSTCLHPLLLCSPGSACWAGAPLRGCHRRALALRRQSRWVAAPRGGGAALRAAAEQDAAGFLPDLLSSLLQLCCEGDVTLTPRRVGKLRPRGARRRDWNLGHLIPKGWGHIQRLGMCQSPDVREARSAWSEEGF